MIERLSASQAGELTSPRTRCSVLTISGTSAGVKPPCLRKVSSTARPLCLPTSTPSRRINDWRTNSAALAWQPAQRDLNSGTVSTCGHGRHQFIGQVVVAQKALEVIDVVDAEQSLALDAQRAARKLAGVAVAIAATAVPERVQVAADRRPRPQGHHQQQDEEAAFHRQHFRVATRPQASRHGLDLETSQATDSNTAFTSRWEDRLAACPWAQDTITSTLLPRPPSTAHSPWASR